MLYPALIYLLFFLIACYFLYWVVRLGVRDGIADADERRDRGGSGQP
ncbi:hypothetical protein [Glycomyces xiaoerkulensis]|nr:hypothetical protein [Glycomyces xiaoerkulensis]